MYSVVGVEVSVAAIVCMVLGGDVHGLGIKVFVLKLNIHCSPCANFHTRETTLHYGFEYLA